MRTDRISGGGRRMVRKQPAQVQVFLQSSAGQRTSKPERKYAGKQHLGQEQRVLLAHVGRVLVELPQH